MALPISRATWRAWRPWVRGIIQSDQVLDAPLRLLAAHSAAARRFYERLHEELPSEPTVETTSWQEKPKAVRVRADDLRRARQP